MKIFLILLLFLLPQLSSANNSCASAWSLIKNQEGRITREQNLQRLGHQEYDLLIIGGGSAGLGSAVEASQRGLKVALVEANDFASETSSRSTKLLHGGVRYLEQLVMTLLKEQRFDKVMYNLIRDALHERQTVLNIAPHLSNPVAIMTPIYKKWQIPYYWMGLKAYDALSGKKGDIPRSRYVSKEEIIKNFPLIEQKNLQGGVLYYDGQFNDSRMAVALAMTAQKSGADVTNHTRVLSLKKEGGILVGARVVDTLTGQEIDIKAKSILNATGPFADQIRHMDDPQAQAMIAGSSGVHLILDSKFVAPKEGILIPKTEDGRVLFILPWEGKTLVGTTDNPSTVQSNPKVQESDIEYILKEAGKFMSTKPTRKDVLSSWAGIRPLVSDPQNQDTAKLARDHVVQVSPAGLVTLTGGKWTTYRKMASDAIDHIIKILGKEPRKSKTDQLILVGGEKFSRDQAQHLAKKYTNIDPEILEHLSHNYGDRAEEIIEMAKPSNFKRLTPHHPFLEAEVTYAYQVEGARSAADVLSRRMRLSFLDQQGTSNVLPRVVEILGDLSGWDSSQKSKELERAQNELHLI